MKTTLTLLVMVIALQVYSQPGENLKISASTATAAKDSFTVYHNNVLQTLMENQDTSRAVILPRYFELSQDVIAALSNQLAQQGENDNLFARLGIMFDVNNKPFVTLIFETKNATTQTSTFFDFSRPCPPACPD